MQKFAIILLIFIFAANLSAQEYLEIRKKITPLHSNRSDVEKIAQFVRKFAGFVRYETNNEFLDVFYSQERCAGHGWDIPKDTVINFQSYPKRGLKLENVLKTNNKFIRIADDVGSNYYINQLEGVEFVVRNGERQIEHFRFSPTGSDSNLRCNGFPKFDLVSEHYSSFETFMIRDISKWDVALLYNSIKQIKQSHKNKLYRNFAPKVLSLAFRRLLRYAEAA